MQGHSNRTVDRRVPITALAAVALAASGLAAAPPVTDGLVVQYDASLGTHTNRSLKDNAAAIEANIGDSVREWFDQATLSGNNIVQQGNSLIGPTLQIAGAGEGLNGNHRVLRFNGSQNLLALDGANDGGDAFGSTLDGTELTWFVVSRSTAATADRTLGAQVGTTANQWGSYYEADGDLLGHARDGGGVIESSRADASAAGIVRDQFVIHSTRWNGASGIHSRATDPLGRHVNGPVTATSGHDAGDFNRFRVGAESGAGNGLDGDIAEVLIYNQALSGRNRTSVEQYLYDRYFRTAADNVVAYYEFNDQAVGSTGTVGSTITDLSGNGHTGAITGGSMSYVTGDTLGHGGTNDLRFSDTSLDRVSVGASSDFAFDADTQSFTVETVFKLDATNVATGDAPALVANQGTGGEWWLRVYEGHTVQFGVAGSTSGSAFSTFTGGSINDGQWHHAAAVYDAASDQIHVYFDFELFSTTAANISGTIGRADRDLLIGEFNSLASGRSFAGDIDMVRITAGALAPAQFQLAPGTLAIPTPSALAAAPLLLAIITRRRIQR